MSLKIRVDYTLCEGNAMCLEAAPDVFDLDDDDIVTLLDESPSEDQRKAVLAAVQRCPKQALALESE